MAATTPAPARTTRTPAATATRERDRPGPGRDSSGAVSPGGRPMVTGGPAPRLDGREQRCAAAPPGGRDGAAPSRNAGSETRRPAWGLRGQVLDDDVVAALDGRRVRLRRVVFAADHLGDDLVEHGRRVVRGGPGIRLGLVLLGVDRLERLSL